jgi:hypothetical protein
MKLVLGFVLGFLRGEDVRVCSLKFQLFSLFFFFSFYLFLWWLKFFFIYIEDMKLGFFIWQLSHLTSLFTLIYSPLLRNILIFYISFILILS